VDPYEQMEALKEALEEAEAQGDQKAQAATLYHIGRIYYKEEVFEAAEDFWNQCQTVCRAGGLDRELGQVLSDLGGLAAHSGKADQAAAYLAEALNLFRHLQEPQGEAKVLDRLGDLLLDQAAPDQALAKFREALSVCRTHQDTIGCLYFLDKIIPLLKKAGVVEEAAAGYREMIGLAEKMGDRERMALGLVGLADVFLKTRQTAQAVPHLEMAHDLYLDLGKEKEAGLIRAEIQRIEGSGPIL